MDFVKLYEAPDEITAQALSEFLKSNGMDIAVQPLSPAGFGGVGEELSGRWGDVLVAEDQLTRAQELLVDYLAATPIEGEAEGDMPQGDWDPKSTPWEEC